MNEAEDKEQDDEIRQLDEEIDQLEEEHSENLEKWVEKKDGLEKIVGQLAEERRKNREKFNKEKDLEKKVELWKEVDEVIKKVFKAEENLSDAAIKYYETARYDYEKLFRKNIEKEIKLTKRLKKFDDKEKERKKEELRMEMMRGARLKKLAILYQKVLSYQEDFKKEVKKIGVELMGMGKGVGEKLKGVAGKIKELEGEEDTKKKQRLQDEIERMRAENREVFIEFNQKFNEYFEIKKKAKKKGENLHRMAYILDYAQDDDEIYVDIFIELQEMSEVTERTAEIQKGMLNQLEHLKKNTSEEQQYKTMRRTVILTTVGTAFVAIFGAIFRELVAIFVAILVAIFGENWVKVLVEKIGVVWAILLVLLAVAMLFVVLFFSFPYIKRLYREILSK